MDMGLDIQTLFGVNARQGSGWMYIQNQGPGVVSFVGSSRIQQAGAHPLRFGSEREHQLIVGDFVIRPRLVLGTNTLRGTGLGGLATNDHDIDHMLSDGEMILGSI